MSEKLQKINSRELIVEMLREITSGESYSHIVIRNVLDKYDYLDAQDKAFIKRVTEGTLERMIQIDYCLNQFSKVEVRKMKPFIRSLMRMSVYQLLFMEHIPDSAVCNEAVKLADKKHFGSLKGFVNGVLRSISRQKESISYPAREENLNRYLSVTYSMPEWIVEMWLETYPERIVEEILKGLLMRHDVTLRISEELEAAQTERVLAELRENGNIYRRHPYLAYAYYVEHIEGLGSLKAFGDGRITAQDVSSMLAVEIADIQEGMFIADVCAAPGGKTAHAAGKLKGSGKVLARDVTEKKALLIRDNVDRMGLHNVEIECFDATRPDAGMTGRADIVLADVPCSGLGVIGKKRDIKYRLTKEGMEELVILQRKILSTVQSYVKEGGVLIFSTCTIHTEENEDMLKWFLGEFPFQTESIEPYLPKVLHGETARKGYLQLLPGIHETDGFFMARLRRMDGMK